MSVESEDDAVPQEAESSEPHAASRLTQERGAVLSSVAASNPDTVLEKVAWILNNYPDARNSDITLQLRYWETFCADIYTGRITAEDLYQLPKLTSLSRARARVQNTLKLFLAESEVRKRRGTLSDEEHEKAVQAKQSSAPTYSVYIDESGKTQKHLIVGSLWILQGPETIRIASKLFDWRINSGFKGELHFSDVTHNTLPYFKQAIETLVTNASAVSLKYVSILRAGTGAVSDVLPKLIYHLLARGVAHEDQTGRAPLPRTINVWKDAEERGYDQLVLADVKDRLKNAATSQFGGNLNVGELDATASDNNDLVQIADLFAASINRLLNTPSTAPTAPNAKDELAQHVLDVTGLSLSAESEERFDDLAVRINL